MFQVIYAEVKPYIYPNEEGNLTGILPEIIEFLEFYCEDYIFPNYSRLADFALKLNYTSQQGAFIQQDYLYGNGIFKDIQKEKAFWFPYMESVDKHDFQHLTKKKLTPHQIILIEELVVIVPKRIVTLNAKFLLGLWNCQALALLLILVSFIISILIWAFEQYSENEEFPKSFVKGFFKSYWYIIVTFVTVGYGDMVTRSIVGRCLTSCWMLLSIVIIAVITATITDTISSKEGLRLNHRKIAVLNHSNEERILRQSFDAEIILKLSNLDVAEAVRTGEAFAGILNADVASWNDPEIRGENTSNPLVLAYTLPAKIPINALYHSTPDTDEIFRCLKRHWDEVVVITRSKYTHHFQLDSLVFVGGAELLGEPFYQVLLVISACLVVGGSLYEGLRVFKNDYFAVKGNKAKPNDV